MYHTIMVSLDGSSFSEHALPLALQIARLSKATLHLVHVHDTNPHHIDVALTHGLHIHDYLASVAQRLAVSWSGTIEIALIDGIVTDTIATYTESHGVDLVVMTTHGRGALSRAWLGSAADQLVRQLSMPVLLVRPHETDPADLTNPAPLKHILIPLDGSDWSASMISHATALGNLTAAHYTLLQTIELPMPDYGSGIYTPMNLDIETWMQDAQQYLRHIAQGMQREGLQVQAEVFIGAPAITILNYAQEHAVDLIALETHGRSGAARIVLGSVADKIMRGAGVPVLLHRPQPATT